MMICKADFEELFPELFRPSDRERSVAEPGAVGRRWWSHDIDKHHPAATPPADAGNSK